MKVLLDNCVKAQVATRFVGHVCFHAVDIGWAHLANGDLLRIANEQFDVLVTVDKNMRFQSSLKGLSLRVAVLDVRSNLSQDLDRGVDQLLAQIQDLPEGQFTLIKI